MTVVQQTLYQPEEEVVVVQVEVVEIEEEATEGVAEEAVAQVPTAVVVAIVAVVQERRRLFNRIGPTTVNHWWTLEPI